MSVEGKFMQTHFMGHVTLVPQKKRRRRSDRSFDRCSDLLPVFPIVTVTENTLCGMKTIIIHLFCPNAQPHICTMGL